MADVEKVVEDPEQEKRVRLSVCPTCGSSERHPKPNYCSNAWHHTDAVPSERDEPIYTAIPVDMLKWWERAIERLTCWTRFGRFAPGYPYRYWDRDIRRPGR